MREWFKKDLTESANIHKPLRIHEEEMRETRCLGKKVIKSVLLDDLETLDNWEAIGDTARIELSQEHVRGCKNSVKFSSVTKLDHWPRAFGRIYTVPKAVRKVNHENWGDVNRISFWVYPDMPGFHSISFRMQLLNGGEHPVPDRYDREGHHNVNLVDGKWQLVSVEIPYLHRDDVIGLSFEYDMVGNEVTATDTACWHITDICLETLDSQDLDIFEGWHPGIGRIAFSGSGYKVGSQKTAIANVPEAREFKLVETQTGRTVLKKDIDVKTGPNGTHQVLDFSNIRTPGEYLLVCGDTVSRSFAINDCVWEDSIWKTINFLFCERCGCEVPGKHYLCHADVTIRHGDLSIVANGGWHDAGDMTQTTTNTAECTYALFELLANIKNNKPLHDRVLEEAKWGLEWILKTRFGDGYRVPTSSKSCWTNNIMGDKDDIYREAAYETIENFMCAGTEALASKYLRTHDPVLSTHCAKVAKEDWNFAWNHRFEEDFCKLDDPNRIYTFLLKYSAAAWSALDVFQATNDEYFKEKAVFCAQEIMQCQQQELTDWDVPFTGFFYDDKSHKLIAHCSHRCHDNEPIQALSRLAQAFPEHENFPDWMYAINLYGDYIQKASRFTAPYNVMPSSIYHEDEAYHAQDYDMGMIKKYLTDDECRENYKLQVRQGISLGKGYYLRRMPVAFEHRGNHAVTLAGGKAVSQAAIAKNDFDLMELANRQFEWIVGKNPFAESVMFGEGYDYCQEYAVLPGEMAGELGVGFACLDEHDSPFWPQVNTCVYKEVWIRPPLLWTWLAADLHGPAFVSGIAKPGSKVTFTEKSTRVAYVIQASPNTGWYQGELPSSEYQVSCDNSSREITLLSSRTYRMDTPFYDFRITAKKTGTSVEFEIQTSGEGLATISLRSSNLDLKPEIRTVKLGEAIAVRAELNDPKKPYYLVLAPKDNPRDIWEAFGY